MAGVYDCPIVSLERTTVQGGVSINVDNQKEIPFEVKRVFYSYNIPIGTSRGAHAHKACHQLLVAAIGSFYALLDDGYNQRVVSLHTPDSGLHILPNIWALQMNFSPNSLCLVLASQEYDEADYIRDYEEFLEYNSRR